MSLWIKAGLSLLLASIPAFGQHAPQHSRQYYESTGQVVWEVDTEQKVVSLTFDDGPDPDNTASILDLLQQYDAKATFFLIGEKVKRNPELAQRAFREGHELANHTYHHLFLSKKSYGKLEKEIVDTEKAIMEATGSRPTLFRPPGGIYNENLIQLARQHGYVVVLWSWHLDTRDWSRPGVERIVSKVLGKVQNGNIVLFHDYVEGGSQTIAALKKILPELQSRGYKMVTVTELLRLKSSNPINANEAK